ncbi:MULTISPECIES: ammonia-forming cytochrome c nitrite reductase subunit c552 [unclassified Adlercreutzia]|uniref:ammonia-forming cytochrome c nitrite reductase subunit c552 n=1 Tax=unclassified Adlercreutzia TaxID=2636013 RepID=UPI0013EB387D|nr:MULTISPECIES: ammonia-forming cytochrome c nitrite reductase subunit c552 [unclassified Adlercreutzia]
MRKRKKAGLAIASISAIALVVGLAACAPQANTTGSFESENMPAEDQFGVVEAAEWAGLYPDQYDTYMKNLENSPQSGKHNYLELYPALNTMYKGYAFALGYDEASSHLYTLESVKNTPRTVKKEQLANCITCKTPQFTALVNADGDEVYKQKFNDLIGDFTEPVSCYNCHTNDPKSLSLPNKYWTNSIGKDIDRIQMSAQVCGQCHNEYYFNPETKATTNPYSGLAGMTPDAILKYYDDMGFTDWTHPETEAKMIKVQHPEFETNYGGKMSPMAKQGYACADCHMGTSVDDTGATFTNHNWTNPTQNPELIESNCSTCHDDITAKVSAIQAQEEERVTAISEKIAKYVGELAAKKGSLDAATLERAQYIQRAAQFYWDFVMVENSEGAHNSELTWSTLDKSEALVDEGLALLA